jgi:branched-chain amino acid transport system ATP-binding protein
VSRTRLLVARALCCGYGKSVVVRELDLHVDAGEVVALLGANGAGKTTTLLTLAGSLPALGGEVLLDGAQAGRWPAPRLARRGVTCIPDDRGLFPKLTVRENLQLASRHRRHQSDALDLFPELRDRRGTPAGLLSGGQQQMLAIARALVREPRLLLIDELSFGLAPVVVQRLLPIVRTVADETGAGVLLVEQHVHLGLAIAERAYVLRHGTIALSGTAAQLRDDASLLHESYLGTPDEPERTSA